MDVVIPKAIRKVVRKIVPDDLVYFGRICDLKTVLKILIKYRYCFPQLLIDLANILKRSLNRTDISDHLITLYCESLMVRPRLIVELGVRGGESTFVFERIARICHSSLISVDIDECSNVCNLNDWSFVRKDDIEFAGEFRDWSINKGICPQIDILFIDTSHLYEHTLQEIKLYFPFLSPKGKVFFHDTNLTGWDNSRGVIRAIEDYLGCHLNEKRYFIVFKKPFQIIHYPFCHGLTILEKVIY